MSTQQPTTPVVQQSTALDAVITESGLQLNDAEVIKQSYLPYFEQLNEIKEQSAKINFEQPTELDETIARELRLKLVKIRTGSEDVKKGRKQIHMLKANLEQSAWNLIKDTCLLDEQKFSAVEKRREIAEANRKETLRMEREAAVEKFGADTEHIALGEMSTEVYTAYYNNVKAGHEQKVAAELKVEEERIAVEQAAADERARFQEENERIQKEIVAKEEQLAKEREVAEKKLAEEQAKARKDAEEVEAKVEAERKKIAAEHEKERLEVEAKRLAVEEIARKESEAKAEIQAKLQAAEDAKAAAEAKRQEAIQAELSKGDADKFKDLLGSLDALKTKYQFKSNKYQELQTGVNGLLDKITAHYGNAGN